MATTGTLTTAGKLGDALFTETQRNVLGLLYGRPERSFYTNEILRKTGMGVATVKRELDRMLDADLVVMSKVGNQRHYRANPRCPIYDELLGIVKKSIGITGVIQKSLAPLAQSIDLAFVYGSVARGAESASSDIDLLIVGEVTFAEVFNALYPAQDELGREINPKVWRKREWEGLVESKDAFVTEILNSPRLHIMGEADEPG